MGDRGRLVLVVRKEERITIGDMDIKVVGQAGRDKYKIIIVADKGAKIGRPELKKRSLSEG